MTYYYCFLVGKGVGLMSYLLINFWFTRVAAVQASFKAFVVNKIGDICLLFAIVTFFYYLHSLDLEIIFSCSQYLPENARSLITAFILFGVMSKSAQIGLHTWLADAMEGFFGALFKFHYMREHPKTIWSTQEQFLLGKIQMVGQSAGNQTQPFGCE